jgi:hypothetical protein
MRNYCATKCHPRASRNPKDGQAAVPNKAALSRWNQQLFAEELESHRLSKKARRAARCGQVGQRLTCLAHFHKFYRPFRCGLWTCRECSRTAGAKMLERYEPRLMRANLSIAVSCPDWVCLLLEFAIDTHGANPGNARHLNDCVAAFWDETKRTLGLSKEDYAVLMFGACDGRQLRVKAVYVGCPLPTDAEDQWRKIAGSGGRLSIFSYSPLEGLRDVFRLSPLDAPAAAAVEAAFDGLRRVRALGNLYGDPAPVKKPKTKQRCPYDGSELLSAVGPWPSVAELEADGYRNIEEVRREVAQSTRAGPSGLAA